MKKCNPSQLQPGEWVSRISYLKVKSVSRSGDIIAVENTDSIKWGINGIDIIQNEIVSSQQYDNEVKLPMTQLAKAFIDIPGNDVFTVHYLKKDGSKRTLVGYRINDDQTVLGRSNVIDLEVKGGRQVDHRTIKWFISKGVKYVLK